MKDKFGTELRLGDKVAFGVTHKQPTLAGIAVGVITLLDAYDWGGDFAFIEKESTGKLNERRCNSILWLAHAE